MFRGLVAKEKKNAKSRKIGLMYSPYLFFDKHYNGVQFLFKKAIYGSESPLTSIVGGFLRKGFPFFILNFNVREVNNNYDATIKKAIKRSFLTNYICNDIFYDLLIVF